MVFLAQPVDAIDNLKDADELLAGEEGGSRDPCSPRASAVPAASRFLHHGDLDGAERSLELALRQEDEGVARQFDPEWQADPARTAERWYWLGEIARRRGDSAAARLRFQRASASPTVPFGRRARALLADPAGLAAEPPASTAIPTAVTTAGSDRNSDTAIKP